MPYCKKCGKELPEEAKYCPTCGTSTSTSEAPVMSATPATQFASEARLASWGERFVAWFIDAIIITVVMGIISLFIGIVSFFSGFSFNVFFNIASWGLNGLAIFLYWLFTEGSSGQSVGKMVMGIKVTRINGSPIDFGQAAIESIGKAFFPILILDFFIGLIFYQKKQQRLFNYLSQTIVVKT